MIIHQGKWQRPSIIPVPSEVAGLPQPVISLNGKWKYKNDLPKNSRLTSEDIDSWEEIIVPGDMSTMSPVISLKNSEEISPATDREYAYKRVISIPDSFENKQVILRFEGSNCHTRIWIDGFYVSSHYGGFTAWDCNITGFVIPGQDSILTVGITEKPAELNPYNKGGLIRDIKLLAVPQVCITRFHGETYFDDEYRDAELKVMLGTSCRGKEQAEVELKLISPSGKEVDIDMSALKFNGQCPERDLSIKIKSPLKWDAEHPRLYTMKAYLKVNGEVIEKVERRIGFRQIQIKGNRVYVNGREVKLRGVCRHEISPLNGRTLTKELMEKDVRLFKEANVNYIRTSHYPPSEYFLDLCDEYGIYVEDEIALAFISRTLKYTPKSPAHAKRYLEFFSEFIERDRSHPSVVIWSLANESFYGPNFALINEYAHT